MWAIFGRIVLPPFFCPPIKCLYSFLALVCLKQAGALEWWSNGAMSLKPIFQYSPAPTLHVYSAYSLAAFCHRICRFSASGTPTKLASMCWRVFGHVEFASGKFADQRMLDAPR